MKLPYVFLVLCLLPFAPLKGETDIRMRGLENRVSNLEKQPDRPLTQITPCAGPRVKDGLDLSLSADFIYWTARLDTLTYAQTGYPNSNTLGQAKKGEVQSVDWSWDPGLKVGLGWNFPHGCWDMLLQYTWFYTNVDHSKRSHYLKPSFNTSSPSDANFTKAKAHFDLHFQVGDLELGRNYYVSRTLKLRPFVGIKGTWQKQDYNTFFTNSQATPPNPTNLTVRFDQALWGLGMRAGLNTSWQFSRHFSLYGNIAAAGIWLHYDNNRKDAYAISNSPEDITTLNTRGKLNLVKPVLEGSLGMRIESYFRDGRYHLLLQAGWESQIWINQTLYINGESHYNRYDLSLQGLTTKVRFDF